MSNTLILQDKKEKIRLSPLQQTFNGRKKRVESLQKERLECTKALDKHLEFYQKELYSKEKELVELFKKEIKLLAPYLNDKKNFNKDKKSGLKRVILSFFEKIEDLEGFSQLDEELSQIYQKNKGSSLQEEQSAEFEEFKSHIQSLFADQGKKIDLSDIEMEGSQDEILDKLFQSLEDQQAFAGVEEKKQSSAKSKRDKEKEQSALEKEELQKKAIGTIYKQLAKAFHPDLEQDPARKIEKQVLMRKLTAAYEAGDLHTILSLEVEQLNISTSQKKAYSDEQLKTYNQVLQKQIEMLQAELHRIPFQQQYSPLLSYVEYSWERGELGLMQIQRDLYKLLKQHKQTIEKLQSSHSIQAINSLIWEQQQLEEAFL